MKKKSQFKFVVLSYLFYSKFIELNRDVKIPKELRNAFSNVIGTTGKYYKKLDFESIVDEVNEAVRKHEKIHIDYLIASITAIVSYYEAVKPKERHFSLIAWKNINEMENDIFEENTDLTIQSQKFCDYIIKQIVKA